MKISIITPSYNQGQFIERTLQSVAMQREQLPEHVALEHVVFDGGSTDNTVNVLTQFKPTVKWTSEKDRGQTHAVNKGIAATDGDIVGWLNSDDIYYPHTLKDVLAFFTQNPECNVVYGMADHIDTNDNPFEVYPTEPWDFERLQKTCLISQPALFFRRRVFEKYGLLNESLKYCMDYEYWIRLAKQGEKFSYVQTKWAGSRLYADTKTLSSRVAVQAEINDMFKHHFGVVPDHRIFSYAHTLSEQTISREKYPYRFLLTTFFHSVLASHRWNKNLLPILISSYELWEKKVIRRRREKQEKHLRVKKK